MGGWVAEWFKAPHLKCGGLKAPWVRILPHPPLLKGKDRLSKFLPSKLKVSNRPAFSCASECPAGYPQE